MWKRKIPMEKAVSETKPGETMTHSGAAILATAFLFAVVPYARAEESPIPTSGDTFTVYSEVQGWTVYSDSQTGTCLIERTDDAGHAVQMGLTKDRQFGYIGVFTQGELPKKDSNEIIVLIDDQLFTGQVRPLSSKKLASGYSGGYLLTDNPNFVTAVAEGKTLIGFPDSPVTFTVDLTGTKAAIEAARECSKALSG
jgi:hypothetical protein